jgi:hypothetical protein
MITICAWTHQIKHEGKWVGLEEYFKDSFGFDATHSISDAAKLKFFAKHAAANPAPDKGATVVTAEMVGIAPLPAPKGSSS